VDPIAVPLLAGRLFYALYINGAQCLHEWVKKVIATAGTVFSEILNMNKNN
jgi:hypothetical protein